MGSQSSIGREAPRFLSVGAIGYIIDVTLFNGLSILSISNLSPLDQFSNKAISTLSAVAFTYIVNSRWTFRHRSGGKKGLTRVAKYFLINFVGMSIQLLALFVSRNILGFTSLLADNIAANVIGVALAAVFRFFANRKWVFLEA